MYYRYKCKDRLSQGVTEERPKYKVPKYVLWYPKTSAPTEVSKSYEVPQHFKKSVCCFSCCFWLPKHLCFAFIPCGIDWSEKLQKLSLFSHGKSSVSNRSIIYSSTAVLMSRFLSVLQRDRILWMSKYFGNHSFVSFCWSRCLHLYCALNSSDKWLSFSLLSLLEHMLVNFAAKDRRTYT